MDRKKQYAQITVPELIEKHSFVFDFFKSVEFTKIDLCTVKKFPSNFSLVTKYGDVDRCFYIVSGALDIVNPFANGKNFVYGEKSFGALIGEMEVVCGKQQYTSTVQTKKNCLTISFSKETYLFWLNNYINFAINAAQRIGFMICETSGSSGKTTVLNADSIIASILVSEFENKFNQNAVCISQTRQQLSDRAGISTRTVNRVVQKFKNNNFISVYLGKIYISQEQYLALINLIN